MLQEISAGGVFAFVEFAEGVHEMDLTVLICTHNSAARLSETLQHLKKQKHTDKIAWEVLIVDYLSTDHTASIARRVWGDYPIPLHILNETKPGKTPALETGLKAARGIAMCIVDDDNWVCEDYVAVAHATMQGHPDVGVIGACGEAHCEVEPPFWFAENSCIYAVGSQGSKQGYVDDKKRLCFWGAGSVIRKDAWLKAKMRGFVPRLNPTRGAESIQIKKGFTAGEDGELCFAIQMVGYRIWYEPRLRYKHYIPRARLSEKFIIDAVHNSSAAAPMMRVYLAEVTQRSCLGLIRKVIYEHWYLHFLYILFYFARAILKSDFKDSSNKLLRVATVKHSCSAQMKAMWDLRKSFDEFVRSIRRLKRKSFEEGVSSQGKLECHRGEDENK
jgi:glycosyltransferase involved in cell wall biosynthesis